MGSRNCEGPSGPSFFFDNLFAAQPFSHAEDVTDAQITLPHLALLLTAGAALANDEVTHPFSTAAPRGHVRRVVIDIPAGEVRIRNGAGDRIAVSGTAERHFDGHRRRAKEQQIVDDISAEVVVNGDEAIVRRRFGPNAQSWSAQELSFVRRSDRGAAAPASTST